MSELMSEIMKLSMAERILLIEAIWDTIPVEEGNEQISEETKSLLDQRLASHEANPKAGANWKEVKARIQAK